MPAVPSGPPPVTVRMVAYGQFLLATGVLGYYLGGDKALHGAVAGGAGDAAMTLMGVMAASENKMVMMIGVHIGIILPVIFSFVFVKQAIKNYEKRDTDARFYLFSLMALGSVMALYTIIKTKPKKERKESKE